MKALTTKSNVKNWQEILKGWESSGVSQSAYCKEHRLSISTFGYYRTKHLKSRQPRKLVSVNVKSTGEVSSHRHFRVKVPSGALIEIPLGLCESSLKRLLRLLGITGC